MSKVLEYVEGFNPMTDFKTEIIDREFTGASRELMERMTDRIAEMEAAILAYKSECKSPVKDPAMMRARRDALFQLLETTN